MHECKSQRKTWGILIYHATRYSLETGSSYKPGAILTANKPQSSSCLYPSPTNGVQSQAQPCSAFSMAGRPLNLGSPTCLSSILANYATSLEQIIRCLKLKHKLKCKLLKWKYCTLISICDAICISENEFSYSIYMISSQNILLDCCLQIIIFYINYGCLLYILWFSWWSYIN